MVSRQSMKDCVMRPPPVGKPVLDTMILANRPGYLAARRRPINPPQSWQKRVTSYRSSSQSHSDIQSTIRS